jgi:hypothetical protein
MAQTIVLDPASKFLLPTAPTLKNPTQQSEAYFKQKPVEVTLSLPTSARSCHHSQEKSAQGQSHDCVKALAKNMAGLMPRPNTSLKQAEKQCLSARSDNSKKSGRPKVLNEHRQEYYTTLANPTLRCLHKHVLRKR